MFSRHQLVALVVVGVLVSYRAIAQPVQWPGNDHWYMTFVKTQGVDWTTADAEATSLGGYLVTVTSVEEHDFVFSLIDSPEYWIVLVVGGSNLYYAGPWTGGLQEKGAQEPDGGWGWVTGEPFTFEAWEEGAPDNLGGNQDRIGYWNSNGLEPVPLWNDRFSTGVSAPSYVVEWESHPCGGIPCCTEVDIDGDGDVDVDDFLLLLAYWGPWCPDPCPPSCPGDFDGDCAVGVNDFLILLANWGECPL